MNISGIIKWGLGLGGLYIVTPYIEGILGFGILIVSDDSDPCVDPIKYWMNGSVLSGDAIKPLKEMGFAENLKVYYKAYDSAGLTEKLQTIEEMYSESGSFIERDRHKKRVKEKHHKAAAEAFKASLPADMHSTEWCVKYHADQEILANM